MSIGYFGAIFQVNFSDLSSLVSGYQKGGVVWWYNA